MVTNIVDQTQTDAQEKLRDKIKLSWGRLPKELRACYNVIKDNDSTFEVQRKKGGHPPSVIYAGVNARGGTIHNLHVSELGPIQFYDAKRAEEILTGALPAARLGWRVIETTWKGRKGGPAWSIVRQCLEIPEEHKAPDDFRLLFFPWWKDAECVREGAVEQIDQETLQYLDYVEGRIGKKLSDPQKVFYYKEKMRLGLFMWSEYPSLLEECWSGMIKGAIYQTYVAKAREEGRIRNITVDGREPVHTFWDLGAPENTVVWYVQFIGQEIRVIDCDGTGMHETTTNRVARMNQKGYDYGTHYLPHDGLQKGKGGITWQQELSAQGFNNSRVVPRMSAKGSFLKPINRMQQLFPRLVFDEKKCKDLLEALENYHWVEDEKKETLKDEPEHDWSSHWADAGRVLAEADLNNMLPEGGVGGSSRMRHRPLLPGYRRQRALTGCGHSGRRF